MDILQQVAVYFLRLVDEVGVGVYLFTFLKQDFPIGAFAAANEENEIVCCRKFTDVRHTVGYLPANGVEVFKGGFGRYVFLDIFHNLPELFPKISWSVNTAGYLC